MKVLHLDTENYPKESIEKLKKDFDFTCYIENKITSELALKTHLKTNSYHIIFVKLGINFNEDLLSTQNNLKFIITPTTGHNHLDTEYLSKRGVNILSLKGEVSFLKNIQSTSEHIWALILCLSKNILIANDQTKNYKWSRTKKSIELNQKTIGIIGYGRLGKIIERYAKSFNMHVLVNDTKPIEQNNTPLNHLLSESDIIVLLIDYKKGNENFINKNKFDLMKNGFIVINCSRGEHINEDDLLEALKSSKIGACGLDVLRNDSKWEIIPKDNTLIEYSKKNENIIITPHIGGYSDFSIFETRRFIVEKLYTILKQI